MGYNPLERLARWHRAAGQTHFVDASDEERDRIRELRATLILEEALEVIEELGFDVVDNLLVPHDRETSYAGLAKELADLKVVTYGTDDIFDIPAEDVFNEVMTSNDSKIHPDGTLHRREDGKILKGPFYRPANVLDLLLRA